MAQQSALDGRGDARSSHTPSAGDQVLERDPREQPRATTPRVCRQFAVNPQPSLRKLRPTDDIVGREGVSPCDHARPPLCALVRDLARAAPAPAPQRETACQNNRSAAQRETACLNFGVVLKVDARAEMCASRLQTPGSARSRNFWLHGGTQSGWNGNHFVPPHGKPVWRVKPLFCKIECLPACHATHAHKKPLCQREEPCVWVCRDTRVGTRFYKKGVWEKRLTRVGHT